MMRAVTYCILFLLSPVMLICTSGIGLIFLAAILLFALKLVFLYSGDINVRYMVFSRKREADRH